LKNPTGLAANGSYLEVAFNDVIERTHRLTGMPRDEIVRRGLVRKEIPIYGVTGVIGGAVLDFIEPRLAFRHRREGVGQYAAG
jgi:hypothetical protein